MSFQMVINIILTACVIGLLIIDRLQVRMNNLLMECVENLLERIKFLEEKNNNE